MHPRRPHRVRLLCLVATGVSAALMWTSIGRRCSVLLENGWYAILGEGELRIGCESPPRRPLSPIDWTISSSWGDRVVLAWRPYRTSMHSLDSGVALPLWLPLTASGLGLAFSHGYLCALRRRSAPGCPSCAYPTADIPFVCGERTCPECGRRERPGKALVIV